MFVYDLSDLAKKVLLTDRLLFTVCEDNNQVSIYGTARYLGQAQLFMSSCVLFG